MDDPKWTTKAIVTMIGQANECLSFAARQVGMLQEAGYGPLKNRQVWALRRLRDKLDEAASTFGWLEAVATADVRHPQIRVLDLEEEVARAVRRAAAIAELTEATIHTRTVEPVRAYADSEVLGRVLDNLLDNALTYSEGRPSVVVEIGSRPVPFVRVRDTGIGLTPEAARRIFERSYRADPDNPSRPGSGIGLYFSRRAAEEMGASLVLESTRLGSGSTFRLDLRGV